MFNRATPHKWMQYSSAKLAMILIALIKARPPLSEILNEKLYFNGGNKNKISIRASSALRWEGTCSTISLSV